MQQLKSIVAELRSLSTDLDRLAAEFKAVKERSSLAQILMKMSADNTLIADALEAAVEEKDGGTVLRAMVPKAEEDTLMAAALLTVASYDLFTVAGSLELSQKVRVLADRMEAIMWQLERAGKELPAPARQAVN